LECSLHLVYDTDDCCNHSRLAPSSQIAYQTTEHGYSSNYSVRARKKISGALPDDTGSDVELNRIVVKDGSIVKTNEVSIDSRPASEERSFSIV
jgi:hypothetical protein